MHDAQYIESAYTLGKVDPLRLQMRVAVRLRSLRFAPATIISTTDRVHRIYRAGGTQYIGNVIP